MGKHNKEFYKSALYDVYDNLLKDDIEKSKYIIRGIIVEDECVNRKCSIINSYVTDKYGFPTMVTELNKGEFIKWIYRGIRRVGKVRMENGEVYEYPPEEIIFCDSNTEIK